MKLLVRPIGLIQLAFIALLITATPAGADSLNTTLDFSLHLSRQDISLKDGQQVINTSVKQLGVTSVDISKHPLQPGLALGYSYISDGDQAVTSGMELEGFYIAPALRDVLLDGQRVSAAFTAVYLYQRVSDSNAAQTVTMEWLQPQLDLDIRYLINRQFGLLLGGQYGRVDVDEQVSGGINQTLHLKHGAEFGYRAGLEIDLGYDGQVGLLLHRAIGDGVELYFQRQF